VLESVSILSHLSRISSKYYEHIHRLNVYSPLSKLFRHSEPIIRSKVCNLLGNLCRHNSYFYDQLIKHSLLRETIASCQDKDSNTRKFACFALGNAGFHNDKLYEYLKPSVTTLVLLLADREEKTRANAAGALGNFARNSNLLVSEMLKH
jgi:fused-like protein